MEKDVNEIIPGLWLGNYRSAYSKRFLQDYNIDYVVSVIDNFDDVYKLPTITYISIPLKDKNFHHFSSNEITILFDVINKVINHVLHEHGRILIHCKRGHHRSASFICAFLMKCNGLDYMFVLHYINTLRPKAFSKDKYITRELFKYYLHLKNIKSENIKCIMGNFCYYVCEDQQLMSPLHHH